MTKKQRIKNLTEVSDKPFVTKDQLLSLHYAIDHLSREWVSRNTHRKMQQELKLSEAEQVRLMKDKNKLKSEIDQLKINKDMLQTAFESKQVEVNDWVKLWEKESDRISELETAATWLAVTVVTLIAALLICLFK